MGMVEGTKGTSPETKCNIMRNNNVEGHESASFEFGTLFFQISSLSECKVKLNILDEIKS